MSNKLEINRDRLFTDGYRKYLQSLTHGALVDFILRGSNLSFTPAQERSLLLEELADEQARHERATKKINSLIHENRELREKIEAFQPVDTSGSFDSDAEPVELTARFKIVDLETNTTLHDGDLSTDPQTLAHQIIAAIFGGVLGETVETKRVYTTAGEYLADHPNATSFTSIGAVGVPLCAEQIDGCEDLLEQFEPYTEVGGTNGRLATVLVVFPDNVTGEAFAKKARELRINPVAFASFIINHYS